jgi:hypothetical protein
MRKFIIIILSLLIIISILSCDYYKKVLLGVNGNAEILIKWINNNNDQNTITSISFLASFPKDSDLIMEYSGEAIPNFWNAPESAYNTDESIKQEWIQQYKVYTETPNSPSEYGELSSFTIKASNYAWLMLVKIKDAADTETDYIMCATVSDIPNMDDYPFEKDKKIHNNT